MGEVSSHGRQVGTNDTARRPTSFGHSVPIALFPDADAIANRAQPAPFSAIELRDLVATLDPSIAYRGSADKARALEVASKAAGAAAENIAVTAPLIDPESVTPRTPVQQYFRIRTHPITVEQELVELCSLIQRATGDLADAAVAAHDLDSILVATAETLRTFSASERLNRRDYAASRAEPSSPIAGDAETTWYRRWIIGHQLHALFNAHAAASVLSAISNLRSAEPGSAIADLRRASTLVGAFGAARAYALALPPKFYDAVLRPSMVPPLNPVSLSGRMHSEYQSYRDAIDELLRAIPEPIETLAARSPQLAMAREALLAADLAEAERHITLIWPVVGQAKSLVQGPRASDNAVSALRAIRRQREVQFLGYVRFIGPDAHAATVDLTESSQSER